MPIEQQCHFVAYLLAIPLTKNSDMGHHHHHGHEHHDHSDTKNLATAFFLNLIFTIIEIIGGLWTNSVAILADAIHDLGDSLSLGLAWYLQNVSKKDPSSSFTYGYRRFSLLGAILTALILIIGGLIVIYESVPRLIQMEETNAGGMIGLAVLGILVNGLAVWRTRSGKSMNEQMVSWHLLEDVLGWVAVLIGALIMFFFDAPFIDPILSIGITLWVMYNVVHQLIKAVKIVLQAAPDDIDQVEIRTALLDLRGVDAVHHLHLWSLDGLKVIMSVHVQTSMRGDLTSLQSLKADIRARLHSFGIDHVTIEMEAEGEIVEKCV